MKIGMQSRLYNAEIRNRRLELGLTQKELGAKIGYPNGQSVGKAESLYTVDASSPVILKLAELFGTEPELLCPPWLYMMEGIPTKADRQNELTQPLLEQVVAQKMALPYTQPATQERDIDREILAKTMKDLILVLTPLQQQIVTLAFGLDGAHQRTIGEIASLLHSSSSSIGQAFKNSVEKLKHHPRAIRTLKHFYDTDPIKEPVKRRVAKRKPNSFLQVDHA